MPCACVAADTRAAIKTIREKVVDALWPQTAMTNDDWRNLMLEIVQRLKGL